MIDGRCSWCKTPAETTLAQECGGCQRLFRCNVDGGCSPRIGSGPACSSCAIKNKLLAKPARRPE